MKNTEAIYLSFAGSLHYIPNADVMNRLFTNWNFKEVQRFTLPIGSPLDNAKLSYTMNGKLWMMSGAEVLFLVANPIDKNAIMAACNFKPI